MGKRLITQRRGRGTSRYKSPSHKYKFNLKMPKDNSSKEGSVIKILNDPSRSAPIAEIKFSDEKVYIPAALEMKTGTIISTNPKNEQVGSIQELSSMPTGSFIYNIEKTPGSSGKFCRAAGTSAKVMTKTKDYVLVQFPSKKQKRFNPNCRAIMGVVAGSGRLDKPVVKAGKKHHMMKARNKLWPNVSGVAMNAVAHPFGSGRGRHIGKTKVPKKNSPPGRNVGLLRAKRTGKK